MIKVMTESTSKDALEQQGWSLRPLNFVMVIEPPAAQINLRSVKPQGEIIPGDFELIQVDRKRNIDRPTHESLLEESLDIHNSIWKTLAER